MFKARTTNYRQHYNNTTDAAAAAIAAASADATFRKTARARIGRARAAARDDGAALGRRKHLKQGSQAPSACASRARRAPRRRPAAPFRGAGATASGT